MLPFLGRQRCPTIRQSPAYPLSRIRAAVARGAVELTEYAREGWARAGVTWNEIVWCIAGLDASCFLRCEISEAAGHEGELFDVYVAPHPTRSDRLMWFKFVLEGDGSVRIFSLHRTKRRR
ncbi:MAG TPA: type II toxin-antitoxin system MqsR family toxin [Longimicrobiaceae bacterium]|nr:type II toxin-antitoxin system MqsR family toxin [Longimicrobiaceae bacterium]